MTPVFEVFVTLSKIDRERCIDIRKTVFVVEQGVPAEMELDEHEDESTHFLLTVNHVDAATGRLRIKNDYIKFERIATRQEYRGQGWGQKLLEFMQAYAEKHFPNHTPAMHAQTSAISFYTKLGWLPQGGIFEEAGIEHRLLIKR